MLKNKNKLFLFLLVATVLLVNILSFIKADYVIGGKDVCQYNYQDRSCKEGFLKSYVNAMGFNRQGTPDSYTYEIEQNNKIYTCSSGQKACNRPDNPLIKTYCCGELSLETCCDNGVDKSKATEETCTGIAGGVIANEKDEQDKCLQPLEVISPSKVKTFADVEEAKKTEPTSFCCKSKEIEREKVKKPGPLGRLATCFGKYWLYDINNEKKFLQNAADKIKFLKTNVKSPCLNLESYDISLSSLTTGYDSILSTPELITAFTEKTSEEKTTELNNFKTEIFKIRQNIGNQITKLNEESKTRTLSENEKNKLGNLSSCSNQLSNAQSNLEQSSSIHAMMLPEIIANNLACLTASFKASQLAYGNAWWGIIPYGLAFTSIVATGKESGKEWTGIGLGIGTSILVGIYKNPGPNAMGLCSLEKPLPGTGNCSTCNKDPLRLCTKERCQILGQCIPIADNESGEYRCEPGTCEERGDIYLSDINATWYTDTEEAGTNSSTAADEKDGRIILNLGYNGEIEWNTKSILVNVSTTELAQCRYIIDKHNTAFEDMIDFEDNYFPETNSKPSVQQIMIPIEGDLSRNMTHVIYIKCNNICNLPHAPSYDFNQIKFKLKSKPDQLPPEIIYIDPAVNSIIRSDVGYVNATFWLDELGTCKYSDMSINYTINYSNGMIPFNEQSPNRENSSVESGSCSGKVKCPDRNADCTVCTLKLDLSKGYEIMNSTTPEFNETKLYHIFIRCEDNSKNVMTEDRILDYMFMTAPTYTINITKPLNSQESYEDKPDIEVESGTRNTQCKYKILERTSRITPKWDNMTFIDENFATIHSGKHNESLEGLPSGKQYTLHALCKDNWGIEATDNVNFSVLKDIRAPRMIRAYHETTIGDFLILETDEESVCAYTFSGCNFNFSQGKLMTGEGYIHSEYWKEKTFFIKCRDKWNNYPAGEDATQNPNHPYCTAILKPFDIPVIG